MPWSGHLNPFSALAGELEERGHQNLFFHLPEFERDFRSRGLEFQAYGEGLYPPGTFAGRASELSRLTGNEAVAHALGTTRMWGEALLEKAAALLEEAALDLLVIDHLDYAASIVARQLSLPFVTVITTLMRHSEEGIPGFTGEPHSPNAAEESSQERLSQLVRPWREFLNDRSLKAGLGPFSYDNVWSELAQITQQPEEFEFPRKRLPDCFHFTGPFLRKNDGGREDFPWDRLTSRPLVYASLGSVSQGHIALLQTIIDAASELDVQLVVSAGAYENELKAPPSAIIRSHVPQLEVLEKATVMIHHAGMNSTLECLSAGVPMIVHPLANDQPGVAKRIEWTRTGLALWPGTEKPGDFRAALSRILVDLEIEASVKRFEKLIAEQRGLQRAADIIEQVALTGKRVNAR